jgi:hypothetical protein
MSSDYGKFNTPLSKWRVPGPSGNSTGTDYDRLYRAIRGGEMDFARVGRGFHVNDQDAEAILSNYCEPPASDPPLERDAIKAAIEVMNRFLSLQGGAL